MKLEKAGLKPGFTPDSYRSIVRCGFRRNNPLLAAIACELALEQQPITLRGLFYRVVSCGFFPSTDSNFDKRLGRVVTRLRTANVMPYSWIVDNLRSTIKPNSWSGLSEFSDAVRSAYRKDFWNHMPSYIHVFCEKDAIAGSVQPVTAEYDVALSPVRGYCSDSFAFYVGTQWSEIEKPIYAYYLGDYDPSGFDIERDLKQKLREHSGKEIYWERLGAIPFNEQIAVTTSWLCSCSQRTPHAVAWGYLLSQLRR